MTEVSPKADEIAELLEPWSDQEREAAEQFIPVIYNELRRQARRFLNRERANHTLQTTALVHEAYLRLQEQPDIKWQNRAHFFGMAGKMMRRILVNYAISRNRQKRGGSAEPLPLDHAITIICNDSHQDLITLDESLIRLYALDKRQSDIVELRYFAGLTIEETAEVLGISPATVKREWKMAKAWLKAELDGS